MTKIKDFKLGATGRFPHGKVNEHDEGELRMAIGADKQQRLVRIMFGKPVAWLGLPLTEAKQFVEMIKEKIEEIEKGGN